MKWREFEKSIPSWSISLKLIYHLQEQGEGGCEEGFWEIHDRHPTPCLSQVRCNHVNLLEKGDNLKKTLWKRQMVLNKEVVFNLIYRGNLIYTGKMRLFEMTSLWTMPMSPVQLPSSSSTPYWESSLRTIEKSKPWVARLTIIWSLDEPPHPHLALSDVVEQVPDEALVGVATEGGEEGWGLHWTHPQVRPRLLHIVKKLLLSIHCQSVSAYKAKIASESSFNIFLWTAFLHYASGATPDLVKPRYKKNGKKKVTMSP